MKITQSALRKIIREELEAVVREDATQPRFNALQNATADILNALGQLRTSLSIAQRKGIPKLAAMVVDGDMTVKSAANKLRASIRSIREDAAKELSKN
jgi:ribosome recycling factor